jgi:hypothetical protein
VLEDTVAAEISEIEATGQRIVGASPDGLDEQNHCVAIFDIEAGQHGILEDVQGDIFSIPGEVAMIGEGV